MLILMMGYKFILEYFLMILRKLYVHKCIWVKGGGGSTINMDKTNIENPNIN